MQKITIDRATREKLAAARGPVRLCDETGRVIGHFTPFADPSMYEGVDAPISEEELRRREQETERYTTREVLDHLKQLDV